MKRRLPSLLALATSSLFSMTALAESHLLECRQLVDVENGRVLENRVIRVDDGRISAIGVARDVAAGEDVQRHQLGTCLPGLMDMHVHLDGQLAKNGYIRRFQMNEADYAYNAVLYAGRTLDAGFTTVRNPGDSYNVTIALRKAIEEGKVQGPRIFTAGKSLATTGGHADPSNGHRADIMGSPGPAEGVVNGPAAASQAVRQRYKDGADFIKITATGGVLSLAKSGQNPQFTMEELQALVDTATDYGMHVAAHAHGTEGMKRAVEAGVSSIEHGTYMDDEVMRLMKEHGTWYVPTILAGVFVGEKSAEEDYFPAVVRPKAAAIGPVISETFARAYRNGVKIAFGTDSGVSPHGENAREFALMVEAGMPAMEAIQSATVSAAELLGVSEELGSLSVGKLADIVAVQGDPIADISELQRVTFVMKDGRQVR